MCAEGVAEMTFRLKPRSALSSLPHLETMYLFGTAVASVNQSDHVKSPASALVIAAAELTVRYLLLAAKNTALLRPPKPGANVTVFTFVMCRALGPLSFACPFSDQKPTSPLL